LYSGSGTGGSVLATSAPVALNSSTFQTVEFTLPLTTLIPGDIYTLYVRPVSGTFGQEYSSSNPYPGGEAFDEFGTAYPDIDIVFAEGLTSSVPEPSTWAMMLIGFAGLGYAGYRASRRRVALS
jgi:hypothetical protein